MVLEKGERSLADGGDLDDLNGIDTSGFIKVTKEYRSL